MSCPVTHIKIAIVRNTECSRQDISILHNSWEAFWQSAWWVGDSESTKDMYG
jgi:hypothetical protein